MFLLLFAAVEIDSPSGGVTGERIVRIEGRSDSDAVEASGSGLRRRAKCEAGRFGLDWILVRGPNLITAFCGGKADAVFVYCTSPVEDVRIVMEWDDEQADLDLHVMEPSGEECWAGNKHTSSGGQLVLEGETSECCVFVSAAPGRYVARVRAFRLPQGRPIEARVMLFLGEELAGSAKLILSGQGEEADALAFKIEGT